MEGKNKEHKHDHASHEALLDNLYSQLKPIFDYSEQGIYIYMDDENKICNEKFAKMLGYSSAKEWSQVKESFPMVFVEEKSRDKLISTYAKAMEKMVGSSIDIVWMKKDKKSISTSVILVPLVYENHGFALHFVSLK